MRVTDSNGTPIKGLIRDKSHALVVDDKSAYAKYMLEKARIEEVAQLRTDVDEMKTMLSQILKAINGKSNI
jgi:hypothetical protein